MRTRRAATSQTQQWAEPLDARTEPALIEATRLDALVEALGQAVARRKDPSRAAGDSRD
jgi:hypothetical protein